MIEELKGKLKYLKLMYLEDTDRINLTIDLLDDVIKALETITNKK